MADGLPDITKLGNAALALPTDVLNTEMRQMGEKINVLNAKAAEAGLPGLPVPGAGSAGLPPLPMLPGMGGSGQAAAPAPATKSAGTRQASTRKMSYLEV